MSHNSIKGENVHVAKSLSDMKQKKDYESKQGKDWVIWKRGSEIDGGSGNHGSGKDCEF